MAMEESKVVEQLREAGNRLLSSSGRDEVLKNLEDLEALLSKVDQNPSLTIQTALLPSMKALISDHVLQNPDSDIRLTLVVCFNEIMRITAPNSPYEDTRMKEIFELIVASFDKLSLLSGFLYSKAVSIIKHVAAVKSCVMMLDIECEELIIEMFKQFKRNLRSDHPNAVISAMEDIMSLIVDESEDIPLGLLKALLDFVYKEKEENPQKTSPMSWRVGVKVMGRSSKKIRPYFTAAIKSGDIRKHDYAPLIYSILEVDFDMEQNHGADSSKPVGAKESADDTTAKPVLGLATSVEGQDTDIIPKPLKALGNEKHSNADMKAVTQKDNERRSPIEGRDAIISKPLKALGNEKHSNASGNADVKAETQKDNERRSPIEGRDAIISKPLKALGNDKHSNASGNADVKAETQKDNKRSSPIEGREASPTKTVPNPLVCLKKSSSPAMKNEKPSKDALPRKENEILTNSGQKNYHGSNEKKLGRTKSGGRSGNKGLPSNLGRSPSEKETNGLDHTAKKMLRRKREQQMDDEVFETPFGIKKYKEDIVGCKLKVWWPKDKAYYEGRITSYSPATKKHRVEYDDGDVEVLNLVAEQFEFIGDEIAVINRKANVKPHPASTELKANQDHSAAMKTETPKTGSKDSNASSTELRAKQDHSAAMKTETLKSPSKNSNAASAELRAKQDHSAAIKTEAPKTASKDINAVSTELRPKQDHSAAMKIETLKSPSKDSNAASNELRAKQDHSAAAKTETPKTTSKDSSAASTDLSTERQDHSAAMKTETPKTASKDIAI